MRLPRLIVPKLEPPYKSGAYWTTVDKEQKKKHYFKNADGSENMLWIASEYGNNHRLKHPNYGTVVGGDGALDFPVGTEVVCHHFTFSNHMGEFEYLWKDENGTEHYRALNNQVYFGVIDGELVPREGVVLCEALVEKIYDTALELPDDLIEGRRDVVRVLKPWPGCDFIKEGDYLLLTSYGDYIFTFKGKDYIKVDLYFDDVLAITNDKNIRKNKVLRHAKGHSELATIR